MRGAFWPMLAASVLCAGVAGAQAAPSSPGPPSAEPSQGAPPSESSPVTSPSASEPGAPPAAPNTATAAQPAALAPPPPVTGGDSGPSSAPPSQAAAAPEPAPSAASPEPSAPAAAAPMLAPASPGADPAMDVSVPPPGPERDSMRRGFYLAGGLGAGFFYAQTTAADARTFTGGSLSVQVAIGGTITPGFVLGGAYMHDEIFGMSVSDEVVDGDEPNLDGVGFRLQQLGPFVDIFPDPRGGLHFQGLVGIGMLDTNRPGGDADDPDGFILTFGAGYDWRLGRFGHAGVLARLSVSSMTSEETFQGDDTTRVITPAIQGTIAFH